MRAGEAFLLKNAGAGTYAVSPNIGLPNILQGGWYELEWLATVGGGNLALQKLGPDNATWEVWPMTLDTNALTTAPVTSLTAAGGAKFWAPPGQYRIVITTSTANYVVITRIPTSE